MTKAVSLAKHPLERLVRCLTVAKEFSIGFVVRHNAADPWGKLFSLSNLLQNQQQLSLSGYFVFNRRNVA